MTVSRVVVIGKSGSGKTSLITALVNKPGASTVNPPATIGIDFQMMLGDGETPTIQFWDLSENMPLARGQRAELVLYVVDSKGDYEEQKKFLLTRLCNLPHKILVVTKAQSEDGSRIQGPELNELAQHLGIDPHLVYFADSSDPEYSCRGLRNTIKEVVSMATPRIPAGTSASQPAASERNPLLGAHEQKQITSETVAAEFAIAVSALDSRDDTGNLKASINALKEGTMLQMQTREISVAKGLETARSTTKLARALVQKPTHDERKAAIREYEDETHPVALACRWIGRLIGAVVGAAAGFTIGLLASTGLGAVAPITVLAAGSVAAKKGAAIGGAIGAALGYGIMHFCTRNKNSPRDGVTRQAEAFSNVRNESERRMSDDADRGVINSGGRRRPSLI